MAGNIFFDILFPKRCVSCGRLGAYICHNCFSKIEFVEPPVCPICKKQSLGGKTHPGCRGNLRLDGLVAACWYRGAVKEAIIKVKYKLIFDIESILVDLLFKNLGKFDLPKDIVLVPVPLHKNRRKWRGFNQAEILAKGLSKAVKVPFADILLRSKETRPQVGLKRDKREGNVKGAFGLKVGASVKGKDIVLVDDVFTSGATIFECCWVLKKAGARKVWAVVAALG